MTGQRMEFDGEFSHAILCALLVHLGGSIELDTDQLGPESFGDQLGQLYDLELLPLDGGRMRISVRAKDR